MGKYLFEIVVLSSVLLILYAVLRVAYVVWWRPNYLEKVLRRQGIRGTSYKFLRGDMAEIRRSILEAQSKPMSLNHHITPRVFPFFYDMMQKYGKVSMTWIGTKPRLIIGDPELIRMILGDKKNDFVKPPQNPLVHMLQRGVSSLDGEQWAKRRRQITPAFHLDKLKGMMPAFSTSCSNFIDRWIKLATPEGSCEVDVAPEFQNITCDVISRTAFGSSFGEGKKIFELQKEQAVLVIEAYYNLYIPGLRFVPTRKNKRRYKLDNEIKTMLRDIIRKKEKEIIHNRPELGATDLLGLLLKCKEQSNNSMTIEEVIEECKLFYFAGQETTSNLLTWTMILLSMHPNWQEKAREEVLRMCGKKSPDFEAISHFKIVAMILNEVMRLYPSVCNLSRYTKRKISINGGMTIPEGIETLLLMLSIHHDPMSWGDDVEEFNPERFSEGVARSTSKDTIDYSLTAFYPFGWGPRRCLGQSFAMIEAKMALAMILQHFSFELSPSYTHAPRTVITLQPQYGAPVILHRL
ncbi:Secologanin synthase [Morus notabilis]|uniref:Secologanin synthase n=1 Tax=Morus notabilis TaxID=981085 RepID=W9RVP7_9ROSA|nr:Secologanin synthase [Morus notabilis]